MPQTIAFRVYGEPVPKGSTKAFYIKKIGRTVTTAGNKNTKAWEQRVATEAQKAQDEHHFYCSEKRAYAIDLEFYFEKPKSKPKKVMNMLTRPDLDKLVRAILDGLTGVLFTDDALIDEIKAVKRYCAPDQPPGLKLTLVKKD